ncbi:geranylgeranylglyceryl/heptaprenylglyceryl phosphate synthase [Aestuariivivens sediminicola]|uniref:geranylgeranylglyceryl/heptaprenylglyceryl phosphate synthase n=1 Tax=Aestuariivivens sediminicola TaxID=2913560 RepID=UPI001F5666E3
MTQKNAIHDNLLNSITAGKRLLAVLIDPDKFCVQNSNGFFEKVNASVATHIFVGGSTVEDHRTAPVIKAVKSHTDLPVVLFPGDVTQLTDNADALLFLSLISGRNPDYLIGKHVDAVSRIPRTTLEIISTGYILIESGKTTAVEKVTNTRPLSRHDLETIVNTATAGELLGMKMIYLEAGSGAPEPIPPAIISATRKAISIPLITGGGIRNKEQLEDAYNAGADMVVIGTAFEENEAFFNQLKK